MMLEFTSMTNKFGPYLGAAHGPYSWIIVEIQKGTYEASYKPLDPYYQGYSNVFISETEVMNFKEVVAAMTQGKRSTPPHEFATVEEAALACERLAEKLAKETV